MTDAQALTYAAFILDGKADAATLEKVCKAGGANVSAGNAKAFAALLAKNSLGDLLKNVSFGGGGAAPAAAAAAAPAAAGKKEEPKKAAKKAESEDDGDMGMGLFD